MRFIYDFDSTLYATGRLWEIWAEELATLGLSMEEIDRTGDELSKTGFSCPGHASMLGIEGEARDEVLRAYCDRWGKENPHMVYPDVVPFVTRNPHTQMILTFGEPGHQEEKIGMSGLRRYIPDVRLASLQNPKHKQIQEIIETGNEPIIFIDDDPKELTAVHEASLPVKLFRMVRSKELITDPHPSDDLHWRVVRSLDELQDLL